MIPAKFSADPSEICSKKKKRRLAVQEDIAVFPVITKSRQQYGIPTYDALFKYVLDEPSLQPSFFRSFAGLNVESAERIDEHMNPIQELQNLRKIINDNETVEAVASLRSKNGISVIKKMKKYASMSDLLNL